MQSPLKNSAMTSPLAVIATQRFALGSRKNDIATINTAPKQWLLAQLEISPAVYFSPNLATSNEILIVQHEYRQQKKAFKKQALQAQEPKNPNPAFYKDLVMDGLKQSLHSSNSFNWRCLDFFSNHFSVTAQGQVMTGLAATLEREAIAPNLFATFEDLLLAVCKHPAMLIYLNNENSIGPSTKRAKKNKGLNENLAREILELHTLGVSGGYLQSDVIELAKGLTGWSVSRPGKDKQQGFIYRSANHESGIRTLMGKTYPEQVGSSKQGEMMLKDLANHPNTAYFISTKIIESFISDKAPKELIDHLVSYWKSSHGNLKTVFQALINHPLSWQWNQQKFKTPREYVFSTYRALNFKHIPIKQVLNALNTLGQPPFKAGSPAGYSDQRADWDGASALMTRINWISKITTQKRLTSTNIETLLEEIFSSKKSITLSTHSYQMITRAESRQQALILLFLSPEFLNR